MFTIDENRVSDGGLEAIFAAVDIVVITAAVVAVYSSSLPSWEG